MLAFAERKRLDVWTLGGERVHSRVVNILAAAQTELLEEAAASHRETLDDRRLNR